MKVLLVQDVEKLGQAGEIREVARGFGRNYLLPKGFAVLATRGQIRQAEERIEARRKRDMAARRDAEALAARINGQTLRFEARVGELDRLYGSVTNVDIATRIKEQLDIDIDRRKIDLEDPIKRVGIYPVKVRLGGNLEPMLNVVVDGVAGSATAGPEANDQTDTDQTDTDDELTAPDVDAEDELTAPDIETDEEPATPGT